MMDWLSALSAQDSSIEGLLAKRNMQKQIASLMDVARLGETKRQHGVESGLEARRIEETAAQRKAQQEAIQAERDRQQRERDIDNKRARYSAGAAHRNPGDVLRDPQVIADVHEFEGSDALSPMENDPTAHIYRKRDFDVAEVHRKAKEEADKVIAKNRERDQQIQEEQLKFQREAAADHHKAAERAQKNFDQRVTVLNKQLEALPPDIRIAAETEAHNATNKEHLVQGSWPNSESDEDFDLRRHNIVKAIYDRYQKEAIAAGRMKAPTPGSNQTNNGATGTESPEHRYWRVNGKVGPEPK